MTSPTPPDERTVTLLGVAGSLRRGSVNRALLAAAHELPPGVRLRPWEGLAALPAFDADIEAGPVPAAVAALRAAVGAADALLIATPEYNGSVPGVLKNAVDWASRPHGRSVLEGRPVAVVGAGPGPTGAAAAQADLVRVLGRAGARVVGGPLPVPQAGRAFDERGRLLDPRLRAALSALLAGLCAAPAPGAAA